MSNFLNGMVSNSSRFDFSASLGATSKVGKDEIRDYNQKQYCQQFS